MAVAAGRVTHAGWHPAWPGRGLYTVLDHGRYHSYYMHLDRTSVPLHGMVMQGEPIAWSGNTGWSEGPHLHFGLFDTSAGIFVDPRPLVPDIAKLREELTP